MLKAAPVATEWMMARMEADAAGDDTMDHADVAIDDRMDYADYRR